MHDVGFSTVGSGYVGRCSLKSCGLSSSWLDAIAESAGFCVQVGPVPTSWSGTISDDTTTLFRASREVRRMPMPLLYSCESVRPLHLSASILFTWPLVHNDLTYTLWFHSLPDLARVVYQSFVDLSLVSFFLTITVEIVSILIVLSSCVRA